MIDPLKQRVVIPPALVDSKSTPTAVRKAAQAFIGLQSRYTEAERQVESAQRRLEREEEHQLQSEADALRAGKQPPAADKLDEARTTLQDRERRVKVHAQAVRDSFAALIAAVESSAEAWRRALTDQAARERQHLVAALEEVRAVDARLRLTLAARMWTTDFPARSELRPPLVGEASMGKPNGDPHTADELIAALMHYATGAPARPAGGLFSSAPQTRFGPTPGLTDTGAGVFVASVAVDE